MKLGSNDISSIKIGSTPVNRVYKNGSIYYQKGPNGNPSLLALTVISDTQINLSWTNGSTDEDGISIERSLDGVTYSQIHTTAAGVAAYSNTGLTENTTYYYRVRAFKGTRYSNYSNVVNINTPAPFFSDSLFQLDGTILNSSGTYYFVDKTANGRNFLITGYDFDSSWTKGFPYKSAATISAPAGDATLIAADVNNFLYTADTPNQIPVISLFQDVDYEHKLFTRHEAQVLDGNGIETYEPRVKDIVFYNTVKTSSDLTKCQTYYSIPIETTTNVKWSTKLGNDTTGNGSKETPWLTLTKEETTTAGYTTYNKTGVYIENGALFNLYLQKAMNWTTLGLAEIRQTNQTNVVYVATTGVMNFKGFNLNAEGKINNLFLFSTAANKTFEKCYLYGALTDEVRSSVTSTTKNVFKDTVIKSTVTASLIRCTAPLDIIGCTLRSSVSEYGLYAYNKGAVGLLTFNYNKVLGSYNNCAVRLGQASQFDLIFLNNKFDITNGGIALSQDQNSNDFRYNIFINKSTSDCLAIGSLGTYSTKTHIINNIFSTKVENNAHHVAIGGEATGAGDNHLLDIQIRSNVLYGHKYYDSASTNTAHGLLVGFQNSASVIEYNYINGCGLAVVIKGSNTNMSNSIFKALLVKNSYASGIYLKATTNNTIANCTLINNGSEFRFSINNGADGSVNNTIKNCIAINQGGLLYLIDVESQTGHTIDYNIYYSDQAKPFSVNNVLLTWSEWQALGYDAHSIMLPTLAAAKALFTDYDNGDYSLIAGSVAIGAGVALDAAYDDGLDASTNWGTDTQLPVVVTKQQGATWDIGAYVH